MNKLFTKIAGLTVGLAMAIGVGVAAGSKDVKKAEAATISGSFSKFTGSSMEAGDYVICSDSKAIKAELTTTSTKRFVAENVTISSNTITDPDEYIVWTASAEVIDNVTYWNFYNSKTEKYLSVGSGSANLVDNPSNNTRQVFSGSNGSYEFKYKSSTDRYLRYHSSDYFGGYQTSTGKSLNIYKKVEVSSDKIDDSSNPFTVTATPSVSRTGNLPDVSAWTVTAKLVGKDTPVAISSGLSIVGTPSTETAGTINVTLRYTAASGAYALNSGATTYDISTTMTVNPITATVAFKESKYVISPSSTITLADEINQTGDGALTYSITQTGTIVSITDGVLTAETLGTATVTVTKGNEYGDSFKVVDSTTIEVSNVLTWSHTFAGDFENGTSNQTKALSGRTWTIDMTSSTYFGTSNGLQMGKAAEPASKVVLSTSAFAAHSAIKEVKVQTWGASGIEATVSVKVGDANYKSNSSTSVSLSTSDTTITFVGDTDSCGDIIITWAQPETLKGIYLKSLSVKYDSTPIIQGGIKASWASNKGSYYNGNKATTNTFATTDLIINTTTSGGQIYGDGDTDGAGFITYLKNSANKWVKTDKTTSDTEVPFIDASSAASSQALSGFDAGTYSLYVTTPKEGGGVWTSAAISFVVVAKTPSTITRASEPLKTEYVAYVDTFGAYNGKISVVYNDTDTDENLTPVIKYYNGDNEVNISTLLNENNAFAVNSNMALTVRLYEEGFVGGDYAYNSYAMYIYAASFTCTDGNGASAEYESGGTVALNPAPKISYTDKDSVAKEIILSSLDVDLFIKAKGASGDGEAYSGTLPEVSESTQYTITAVYKGNSSFKASYDITVVNATFSIDASGATKTFAFGTNYSKTGLVVQVQYGTAAPVVIDAANYTVEDENGNELDIIKFIGTKTVTVRYKGYSATYEITGTNVGSSETYVHDDIPGSWELGNSTVSTVSKTDITATSLGSSSRLTKGSVLTFVNAYGEDTIVGAISVTFQVKSSSSSNAGATFTFKMTALSGTAETENVVTGVKKTLTASYANVTLSINNISSADEVNGWKIEVTDKVNGSGSQNGNADWNTFSGTHTPYTLGPDQTFNATPLEQALEFARYFLEVTDEYCTVDLSTAIKTTLGNEFNGMVPKAKELFTSAEVKRGKGVSYENDLSEALSRYVNMVEEKNTGDFLSLGNEVLQKGAIRNDIIFNSNSATLIIIIASIVSLTAIGGYFLFKKKRQQ